MCNLEKDYNDFTRNKTREDGYENYCKDCKNTYYKKSYSTPKGRARMLKSNCARRSRQNGYDFDLTSDWIIQRIEEGCVLTGVKFNLDDVYNPFAPSIDRIDSSKGYTKDNCRLIVTIANFAKNEWNDEALYIFAEKLLSKRS